jgi:DNA-binding NarL/FixJ family response regulator
LEQQGFEIVAEADDGHEAAKLARTVAFDVALLDVSMPRMNGMDCARALLAAAPDTRIVLLTMHTEEEQIARSLRIGVRGYVCKSQTADELSEAIREVFAGGTYLNPRAAAVLLSAYRTGATVGDDPLTLRERQVLQLVAEGSTTKEVAITLGLTTKTAESYRARVMAKLDIHDTASLVRYALRHGLTQLSLILIEAAFKYLGTGGPRYFTR